MSFCSDEDEVKGYIDSYTSGKITKDELMLWFLSAIKYECDFPEAHRNCYKNRCLIWADHLYLTLEDEENAK